MILVYEAKNNGHRTLVAIFERRENYLDSFLKMEERARERDAIISEIEIPQNLSAFIPTKYQ